MPANNIKLQQLDASNIQQMRQLNLMFATAFEDEENYSGAKPDDKYLVSFLTKPHNMALVATDEGAVIGGLVAYELEKFEQVRTEFYIYDLAVDENYRRLGIATRLIKKLSEIGTQRGSSVMYVQADYGDEPAIALYTKLGRREDVMHFDIRFK